MKETITIYSFREAFKKLVPNNFSYQGSGVLFEHLTELEDGSGEELELDVYAFCQDYEELSFDEIRERYEVPEDVEDEELWRHVDEYIAETDHSLILIRR